MKRIVVALAVGFAAAALLVYVAPRAFGKTPDHYTCHHGASEKPCRPDPQPEHGRDCDHPHFGINQDHCKGATPTPTPQPTPTPTPTPTTPPQSTQTPVPQTQPAQSGVPGNAPEALAHTGALTTGLLILALIGASIFVLGLLITFIGAILTGWDQGKNVRR